MATYQVGETIRLTATITDVDSVAADPATVKIAIDKPDGEEAVSATDMEKSETGSYYYDYLISTMTGNYSYSVTGTGSGGRITITKDTFFVNVAI